MTTTTWGERETRRTEPAIWFEFPARIHDTTSSTDISCPHHRTSQLTADKRTQENRIQKAKPRRTRLLHPSVQAAPLRARCAYHTRTGPRAATIRPWFGSSNLQHRLRARDSAPIRDPGSPLLRLLLRARQMDIPPTIPPATELSSTPG